MSRTCVCGAHMCVCDLLLIFFLLFAEFSIKICILLIYMYICPYDCHRKLLTFYFKCMLIKAKLVIKKVEKINVKLFIVLSFR